MRKITSLLKDKEFTEHLSEMQLALFTDNQLKPKEREEVFKHLSQCKRCRDILKIASELKEDEKRLKSINNIDYKGTLKRLGAVVAIVVIFFSVPQIDHQFNTPAFKGYVAEKNILEKSIEYWEKLFEKWFGNKN